MTKGWSKEEDPLISSERMSNSEESVKEAQEQDFTDSQILEDSSFLKGKPGGVGNNYKDVRPFPKRNLVGGITLGATLLGGLSGCSQAKPSKNVEEPPAKIQDISGTDLYEEVKHFEEIPSEESSTFGEETSYGEKHIFPSYGPDEYEELVDTKGQIQEQGVQDITDESSSVEEGDIDLEAILTPEVLEILSLSPSLSINEEGEMFFVDSMGEVLPVCTFETNRHLSYPYEHVNEVKFFVIHYDGAPQIRPSGEYRTVFNTLNGLNRVGLPSVQYCVDSFPVTNTPEEGVGLGVVQTQASSPVPYKGKHISVGIELSTGREDIARIKTATTFEELRIGQRFVDFVGSGQKDFDSYSVAVEQVGTNFSINFPEQFPPNQQIANVLGLSRAVASRYGLSVWDIVGHGEMQEKSDPGDEYMLTLRYLLGLNFISDASSFPPDFLRVTDPVKYFTVLREYSVSRMGEQRYESWNEKYRLDDLILGLRAKVKEGVSFPDYYDE